jgi:hypothetical protein
MLDKPEIMPLVWILQSMQKDWTDDECLAFATTQRVKQRDADRRAIAARLLAISKENTDLKSFEAAIMELQKELEEKC